MLSPWDDQEQAIRLVRDGGEHVVTGIEVYTSDDPDDDRFAIGFQTADRTLRVRLPGDQLAMLGQTLLDLAERRRRIS
jgi:hypothetical protein